VTYVKLEDVRAMIERLASSSSSTDAIARTAFRMFSMSALEGLGELPPVAAPGDEAVTPIAYVPRYRADAPKRVDFAPGDFDWMSVWQVGHEPCAPHQNWDDVALYTHPPALGAEWTMEDAKDAARYRWLRDEHREYVAQFWPANFTNGDTVDERIDAEMKKALPQGRPAAEVGEGVSDFEAHYWSSHGFLPAFGVPLERNGVRHSSQYVMGFNKALRNVRDAAEAGATLDQATSVPPQQTPSSAGGDEAAVEVDALRNVYECARGWMRHYGVDKERSVKYMHELEDAIDRMKEIDAGYGDPTPPALAGEGGDS